MTKTYTYSISVGGETFVFPPPEEKKSHVPKQLLSLRMAARELGISRSKSLPRYIRAGLIKTTSIGGRVRISRDEIDRVLRDGLPPLDALRFKPARTAKPKGAKKTGDQIRAEILALPRPVRPV